jgi:hypothetical protein
MCKIKDDVSLEKMRHELKMAQLKREHELKMTQLKRERELLELDRKNELDMLKLRGGCLGRIFGCS